MRFPLLVLTGLLLLTPLSTAGAVARQDVDYVADVEFACDEIVRQCAALLRTKDLDWKKIRKEYVRAAGGVETDEQHFELLVRLLARLRDGHAGVRKTEKTADLPWPTFGRDALTGCGMFLCVSGKKVYVRSTWNAARAIGLEPGMEILKIDGIGASRWIDERLGDRLEKEVRQHREAG